MFVKLISVYVRGLHGGGMLATLKHFPCHGYTDVDLAALIELEAAGADLELAQDSAPVDDGLADRSPGAVSA